MQELLRVAQMVCMRRDEEKQKAQAKVLVAVVREAQNKEWAQDPVKPTQNHQPHRRQNPSQKKNSEKYPRVLLLQEERPF